MKLRLVLAVGRRWSCSGCFLNHSHSVTISWRLHPSWLALKPSWKQPKKKCSYSKTSKMWFPGTVISKVESPTDPKLIFFWLSIVFVCFLYVRKFESHFWPWLFWTQTIFAKKKKEQKQKIVFPSIFVLFIPTDQATQRFLDRNQLREETKRYGTRLALFGGASDSFYFPRKLEKQEAPQNRYGVASLS